MGTAKSIEIVGSRTGKPKPARKIRPNKSLAFDPAEVGTDFHWAMEEAQRNGWISRDQDILKGKLYTFEISTLLRGIPRPARVEVPYSFTEQVPLNGRIRTFSQKGTVDAILDDGTLLDWKVRFGKIVSKRYRESPQWLWYLHAFPEAPEFRFVVFQLEAVKAEGKIRRFRLVRRKDLRMLRTPDLNRRVGQALVRLAEQGRRPSRTGRRKRRTARAA